MAVIKQKIVPHLWFDKEAKEATEFYCAVFPDSGITSTTMKIDMSPSSITLRLKQVSQLRRACLTLAKSSEGRRIRRINAANKSVQRTSLALGR